MKHIRIIFTISGLFFLLATNAQSINWNNIEKQNRHIINANFGVEYGIVYGLGYGYCTSTKIPVVINVEYSFPSGNKLFDDFKTKLGGKIRLLKINNIHFSANIYGIYRKYNAEFVQLQNFGSDFSATVGYYKSRWFVAGNIGFDKAIVTHFKHGNRYKTNFPEVKNGWYEPATGGNAYYGLLAGISLKRTDITLKAGKIIEQDLKTKPLIPFFAELGFNLRF